VVAQVSYLECETHCVRHSNTQGVRARLRQVPAGRSGEALNFSESLTPTLTERILMKQIQYDDEGTPYGYKYVLVGVYWSGEEPVMYKYNKKHDTDQRIAFAIEDALRKQHPDIDGIDVGFIQDGLKPDYAWRKGTWRHFSEVVEYLAWRLYLAVRKVRWY
jgi:hypothetical protein